MKNKIALSAVDDKRYLIPGTTKTLAWGHVDIVPEMVNENLDMLMEIIDDDLQRQDLSRLIELLENEL